MASKNPSNDVTAKVAFDGRRGYGKCQSVNPKLPFWNSGSGCDPGFVPDPVNGYCYKLLPDLMSLEDGDKSCESLYDADLLAFDTEDEVKGLANLIGKGESIKMTSLLIL